MTPAPQKKEKLNNKQGTEMDMQQRGWGALSVLEKGGRSKKLLCVPTFSKQTLQKYPADSRWVMSAA
jgi:hypothetical protein